ncbi:MAG: hypothetical protein Q4F29_06890, partial [Lachnospiraceae bacterium]|nr:hypothetical protein [Lachnospiraceae bacterium]
LRHAEHKPAAKLALRRLKVRSVRPAAVLWQNARNIIYAVRHYAHEKPVHSREADGQNQGATCERIEKLVCVQAAGEAAKIPFTERDF